MTNSERSQQVEPRQLVIRYRNWKGEISDRRIEPGRLYFGTTEHHPERQWLLHVFDFDKRDYRTFAVKDIISWSAATTEPVAPAASRAVEPICEKCSTEKLGQFHKPEDCPLRNYNFQDAPPIAAQSQKEKS